MYYNVCEYCGASLDCGERCDCPQSLRSIRQRKKRFKTKKSAQYCGTELIKVSKLG